MTLVKKILVFVGKAFFLLDRVKKKTISIYLNYIYKKKIKKIGKCVRFNGISTITGLENIEIGNNVHIGNNAFIRGEGGLFIGDNTHISRNLVLYTINHNYEGKLLPYDNTYRYRKVVIEKNVWIGMNVVILPGAYIEEGAIIGAGAVVAGRVPKGAIYVASEGRILKYRDMKHYEFLEKERQYGGINGNELPKDCL